MIKGLRKVGSFCYFILATIDINITLLVHLLKEGQHRASVCKPLVHLMLTILTQNSGGAGYHTCCRSR